MRRSFSILLLIVLSTSLIAAEWKSRARKFLGAIKDFDGLSFYLVEQLKTVAPADEPLIYMTLAYSFGKLGNTKNELLWLSTYFDKFGHTMASAPVIDFFGDADNISIQEYINGWHFKYPQILGIALITNSFPYSKVVDRVEWKVTMLNPGFYRLMQGEEVLSKGLLVKGDNLISWKSIPIEKIAPKSSMTFSFEVSSSTVVLSKRLNVTLNPIIPQDLELREGILHSRTEKFLDEYETKRSVEKKTYFDTKGFLKNSLPLLVIGIGGLTLNETVVSSQVDSHPDTPFYFSSHRAIRITSIAVSLKGIYNLISNFKSKAEIKEFRVESPEAKKKNQFIRNLLSSREKEIVFTLSLSIE